MVSPSFSNPNSRLSPNGHLSHASLSCYFYFIYFFVIPLVLSLGQKHGKKLAAKRTKALVDSTNFNEEEIHALNVYFDGLGKKKGKETEIDRAQFKSALGLKESLFINRMFLMFDTGTYFLP